MSDIMENKTSGFTLIELLIAMTLSLLVIASLGTVFLTQFKTYDLQEQLVEMTQNARAAMDMMTSEIRMAGYDYNGTMNSTDPNAADFVGIPYNATQIECYADLNRDGDTNDSNEHITYKYFDTTSYPKQIKRKTGSGSFQPFAENIQGLSYIYFDENGNATTTTSDIHMLKITIEARTAEPDPEYADNNGYRTYELSSYVAPPNLALAGLSAGGAGGGSGGGSGGGIRRRIRRRFRG